MQIYIKNLKDRKTFQISIEQHGNAQDLKAAIERAEGIPADSQRLIFSGKPLREGTLAAHGIQKGATLHLVLKLKTDVDIKVRIMNGKMLDVTADPHAPVATLLANIHELLGLDDRPRVLAFGGQCLLERATLTGHGIRDKSLVHVVLVPVPNQPSLYEHLGATAEADRTRVYGMAGSLYARCGGIFGVAAFVDRCMDAWMADPTLNANDAVATWHERAQRCGFKFLVTQLMGYLCGGPQVYTGRSMAASHKHLNISEEEWGAFIRVTNGVCAAFELPVDDTADLIAVVSSMQIECTVGEGEGVPPNPGHPAPAGNSLYARLGGVYPIALFCDRLVDALLADRTTRIPLDAKRTPAALKYLFTELVCNKCGGPEPMTATYNKGWAMTAGGIVGYMISVFSPRSGAGGSAAAGAQEVQGAQLLETRMLCSSKELFQLLRCAEAASDHVRYGALRTELMQLLHAHRGLLLDPSRTNKEDPHGYVKAIDTIARETKVPMTYIVGGGAIFFAGREFHFGDATPEQQAACWERLGRLGFRRQRVPHVKSVNEAAAGAVLGVEVIRARQASAGSYVEAEKRVYGDPRTLYGRGGGVFGLAKLADRLMDSWMNNTTLNANAKVAPWTKSGQRQGFKFLVTQVMGYLTGGPQRYTGQPMDVAHKHLNISAAEWDVFMRTASCAMDALRIDAATQKELGDIFRTFRSDVIIEGGEKVPKDPGLCRKPPNGNMTYAQAGGVYPLAAFADRLVELVLTSDALKVQWEEVKAPGATRHPPGLKYLLTELCCNAAGGPEGVTARGFEAAKLGVLADQWDDFMDLVAGAAEMVWPNNELIIQSVKGLVRDLQPDICLGMVAPGSADGARKLLHDAGYSHVQITAALLEANDDGATALQLLTSGKVALPPPQLVTGASKCPLSGGDAVPMGADVSNGAARAPALVAALPGPLATAVRTMAASGMTAEAIAPILKLELPAVQQTLASREPMDVSDTKAQVAPAECAVSGQAAAGERKCPFGFGSAVTPGAVATLAERSPAALVAMLRERFNARTSRAEEHIAGRVLSNDTQRRLDELLVEPAQFCCPITLILLTEPVIASDSFIYERAAISIVVQQGKLSPMTHELLSAELLPAPKQRAKALAFMHASASELVRFAGELSGVPHAHATRESELTHKQMVTTALDRVQLYLSTLLTDSGMRAQTTPLAKAFHAMCTEHGRPLSTDVLAVVAPSQKLTLRVRVMTGDEVTLSVVAATTSEQISAQALQKTVGGVFGALFSSFISVDKARTLNHQGKRLPPRSTLAEHKIVDGSILHLVLEPSDLPASITKRVQDGRKALDAARVASETEAPEDVVRAYGKQKSLYFKCGGIFGVAAFVDRCMDAWMADPTLNANDAVATWHERAQRCGFKFLVTQLMGYLCGGPQVYTGRSMAASHKHLNISEEEWGAFMEGLHEVMAELSLTEEVANDVAAVILSMQSDCVVQDGETPPENPGHPAPASDSLYARAGGVYPIALFCDRLVDALLSDSGVTIPLDASTRTMASLKYLFTELVATHAGGQQETMTAPSLKTTRLQLSQQDFVKLLGCVAASADHLAPELATELALLLHCAMDMIVRKPPDWKRSCAAGGKKMSHAEIRATLQKMAASVGHPILYVPNGNSSGFLIAMEQGASEDAKKERRAASMALGFEENKALQGVAMLYPRDVDKDVLFVIDISGSMSVGRKLGSGSRLENATNNALRIFDKFTNENDHLGLVWFHHETQIRFPLTPRCPRLRKEIDATRRAPLGGTAFYDALINAVKIKPCSRNSYLVALTDGADCESEHSLLDAIEALARSPYTALVIGLEVDDEVREKCERLANATLSGMYIHAQDAAAGLDAAFELVVAQFVMPQVKSADAAAAGGGARGV